jgi:CubicO group peptidase (beta-lactamase class C family)
MSIFRRKEFIRVAPEEVGVPSEAVNWLLDRLEEGWTEPHGLMLMRKGKIFAEGWWSPYAPGIRHGLQSHTKTYAATAVGIAYTEGLLSLDERIIDIFPDKAPEEPSENLKKLKVRHVLSMGCGMDEMPRPGLDWIRDFLATPVNHEPGTTYMYNSTGSTLLGAIVREKTGLGLHDYLKPRLFDKIGIDAANLRWMRMPDGMEVGGGGLLATTEDNLRLMKLYADGGVWEGERILAEDYVKLATTLQNESATEEAVNPPAKDNFVGYGYQIWMCRPKGVYRADGAMGQFTIVVPDKDMIIAITENASGAHWAQKTLDIMWDFLERIPEGEALPENAEAAAKLKRRLSSLALPNEAYAPFSQRRSMIDGASFNVVSGKLYLGDMMRIFMSGAKPSGEISQFGFKFNEDSCDITIVRDGVQEVLTAATDGSRRRNVFDGAQLLLSAFWPSDDTLRLVIRNIEGCHKKILNFTFKGTGCLINEEGGSMFMGGAAEPVIASLI